MEAVVKRTYHIPPVIPPCIQFTIRFGSPINLDIVKDKIKLNKNVSDGIGGILGSQKTKYGTIMYSKKCIQVMISPHYEDMWSKKFVPFFEKLFGFKIDRKFTDCGETWSISEDRSLARRSGFSTFWEDLIGYYGLEFE